MCSPETDDRHDRPLLGLLLRLATQQWGEDIDDALQDAGFGGIRPPHANVFAFLPPDGIQVGVLADRAGVRKQSMAQSIEELERAGYVERRPDPADRRAKLVFLTSRGQAVRPIAVATGRRTEERWARLTSPEDIETLRRILMRLLDALDTDSAGG